MNFKVSALDTKYYRHNMSHGEYCVSILVTCKWAPCWTLWPEDKFSLNISFSTRKYFNNFPDPY